MAAQKTRRSSKRRPLQPSGAVRAAGGKGKNAGVPSARPGKPSSATASSKATKAKQTKQAKQAKQTKPSRVGAAKKTKQAKISRVGPAKKAGSNPLRYLQADGWEVIEVADGIAVHDGGFKTVHYLNHTAAIVFLLCKQPMDLEVLCAVFREEFGLKRAPRAELRGILVQMEASGLLLTHRPEGQKGSGVRSGRRT